MIDRTDNQLRACVKALEDVIGPAMDREDSQAAEQLFLVADYLKFLRSRLGRLHARDLFEIDHDTAMGEAILEDARSCAPGAAAELAAAIASAREAGADPRTPTPALKDAAARVAAAIRTVIRESAGSPDPGRGRIESTIVAMTRAQIEADRAWHLPQGFDPDPAGARDLDEALSPSATTTTTQEPAP